MNDHMIEEYEQKDFEMYFQNERPEMLHYIPLDVRRVLDVGCSDGSFGWRLKVERNIEVWGIEPNERAAGIACHRLDKVICNTFDRDLDLPPKEFDCIIFNDVLEHMVDPYSALSFCHSLLNRSGVIVASVPNVRYFDNIWNLIVHENWEYMDWGILDKTHLRFFTRKSIISTFESLDYKVKHIEGINTLEKVHPYHARKFNILNKLLFKKIEDMRYLQFAVVASPN